MSREKQKAAEKGSQHWIQRMVENSPEVFERAVEKIPALEGAGPITWLSPLASDSYAEYRDGAFLRKLEVKLARTPLKEFWPKRGPVWDGLARTQRGDLLLVEAKANLAELASGGTKASDPSAKLIRKSLDAAKPAFGVRPEVDWTSTYYQYANRLAHLYLLRELNSLSAYVVFLYFVNARDVSGPSSKSEWKPAIDNLHARLELTEGRLSPFVIEVFVDVDELKA